MAVDATTKKLRWAYLPECDALPSGWRAVPFTDLCQVIAGQSPPSETYNEKGMGLPFLQGNGDFSERYPQPRSWCTAPAKVAERGDTLISVRAPVGEVNRADQRYAIGRGLAAILAKTVDAEFIHQAIQRWRWSLQRVAQGTTFDAVTARHFGQLLVAVPDCADEQAAIARVLDAVDAAIDRAQYALSKARELQTSVVQSLVAECVKQFRSQALGDLILEGPTNGLYRPESDYGVKGTPIVRIDSFANGSITNLPGLRRVVVPSVIRERFALKQGDVLINRVNALTHVGKAAVVPELSEPTLFESNMMRLSCAETLVPEYLGVILRSDIARRHWLARSKPAVNQVSVNQRDTKSLCLPLPDPDRQREIAQAVHAADALVLRCQERISTLQSLKKSLMHDLLTGTVRVDPAALQEQQA